MQFYINNFNSILHSSLYVTLFKQKLSTIWSLTIARYYTNYATVHSRAGHTLQPCPPIISPEVISVDITRGVVVREFDFIRLRYTNIHGRRWRLACHATILANSFCSLQKKIIRRVFVISTFTYGDAHYQFCSGSEHGV